MTLRRASFILLFVCLAVAPLLGRQARTTIANGTTLPTTCANGDLFYLTTSNTTGQLNTCVVANTWSPVNTLPSMTFYVCAKAASGTCVYNGDAGTVATPSDSNACVTKALPCATIAGVQTIMSGKVLIGTVTIQLADTAGTGTDCYQPNGVIFDMPTQGSGTPFYNIYGASPSTNTDAYPSVYIFIQGNTTTRTNVKFNGSGTCTGTTSSKGTALFFKGNSARVRGVETDYYAGGVFECQTCNFWLEDDTTTSDSANFAVVAESYWNASMRIGGALTVTNAAAIQGNFYSMVVPCTPLSCVTFVGSNANWVANQNSQIVVQGGTYTFGGSGSYAAWQAIAFGQIFMNATTNSVISMTFNDASLTELNASQGSRIDEACGSSNFTCTFTSLSARALARSDSKISYVGTSSADSASTVFSNGCINQSSFPNYIPNLCAQKFSSVILSPAVASTNYLTLNTTAQSTAQTLSFPNIREAEVSDVFRLPIDAIFAAPTGTSTTASFVMMGLGAGGGTNALITPQVAQNGTSPVIMIDIDGNWGNSTIGDGCNAKVAWGTGSAPANAAAATGTILANSLRQYVAETVAGQNHAGFHTAILSGLTAGTQIWVDLQFQAVTGGTCTFKNVETRLWER